MIGGTPNISQTYSNRNVMKRSSMHVRTAQIQISLRIRAVWSESSLGAFWIAKDAKVLHADNEDSDQTAPMRSLIWVFVGRKCQKVRFLPLRFLWYIISSRNKDAMFPLHHVCLTSFYVVYTASLTLSDVSTMSRCIPYFTEYTCFEIFSIILYKGDNYLWLPL